MLCHQCGSPVSSTDSTCPNCQADLKRDVEHRELRADGLKRMTRQLRAVQVEARYFPYDEVISERFKLGELLGKGPFGEVYRAQDSLIDAEVALKVFAPELIENPQDQERFLKVTRTARTLTQPNVVRVHTSGVHKAHAWVSMQPLEGLSLRKVMKMRRQKREPFSMQDMEPLVTQITLALGHVHREFAVGNLKPENIIFLPDLIKLTDHYLLAAFSPAQFAQRLVDSPYLAPELRRGGRDPDIKQVDPRCDVYSLGAILGEMVFGPDYVPGAAPEASNALDALCRRACALKPEDRYESIEALSEDFSTLLDTGGLLTGEDDEVAASGASRTVAKQTIQGMPAPIGPPPAPRAPATAVEPAALPPAPGADALSVLAEEIATREYVRGQDPEPELGDLLATNEVRRDHKRAPGAGAPAPAASEAKPPVTKEVPKAPKSSKKSDADPAVEPRVTETTATAVKPIAAPSGTRDAEASGLSPGLALAAVAILLLVVGVVVWSGTNKEEKPVELGDANANIAARDDNAQPSMADAPTPGELEKPAAPDDEGLRAATAAATRLTDAAQVGAREETSAAAAALQAEAGESATAHAADALQVAAAAQAATEAQRDPAPDDKGAREGTPAQAAGAVAALTPSARPSDTPAPTPVPQPAEKPVEKSAAKPADPAPSKPAEPAVTKPAAVAAAAQAPAAPAEKPAAAGTRCKAGMLLIKAKDGNYCVDAYEYPRAGAKPTTNVSWFKARQMCEADGKRLCALSEWRQACGGKYPYGNKWDADRCNTVDEDEFDRSLAAAGSFKGCRSRSGAYDMVGNAHEWVAEQRVAGGGYDSGEDVATCSYSSAKAPSSAGSNIGFRCCADAE